MMSLALELEPLELELEPPNERLSLENDYS
jgi:hypothetical protein